MLPSQGLHVFYHHQQPASPSQCSSSQPPRLHAVTCVPALPLHPTTTTKKQQVTFTIPAALRKQPLLYSGLIELQSDDPGVPSLVVPYQGFSQPMSNLRVPAVVDPDQDIVLSATLDKLHNSLCYAPSSKPKFINAILDAQVGAGEEEGGGGGGEGGGRLRLEAHRLWVLLSQQEHAAHCLPATQLRL